MRIIALSLALWVIVLSAKQPEETVIQTTQRIGSNINWLISETFK